MLVKYIKNGNIQQSLEHVCLILHMNDERITEIENDFIEICNFIGLNMEFEHAKRWFDIVNSTYQFITNETMKVDDVLVLCSKMCSLCKLINENTVINMKSLRSQVINELEDTLKHQYISSFDNILPLRTSDSYPVACKITMCFIKYYEKAQQLDPDSSELFLLSNKIRLCIEYISRKNIYIENNKTKDSDCIWFLWNIILQLTQSPSINIIYKLFCINWKSTIRKKRLGILWGTVYLLRHKDIEWNSLDIENFEKIKNLSKNLMIEIKNRFPKKVVQPKRNVNDDIKNIWDTYIPSNK